MLDIEWQSSVVQHGRHAGKLKSSTVHGWLVKMRGTIIGDEKMRSKGIREMKSAKNHRAHNASAPRRITAGKKTSSGSGVFSSLFGSTKKHSSSGGSRSSGKSRAAGGRAPRRAQTMPVKRVDNRPGPGSRRPSQGSRRPSAHSSRPPVRRRPGGGAVRANTR